MFKRCLKIGNLSQCTFLAWHNSKTLLLCFSGVFRVGLLQEASGVSERAGALAV